MAKLVWTGGNQGSTTQGWFTNGWLHLHHVWPCIWWFTENREIK